MKENLIQIKQRYNKIEQERKKLLSYNNSLEKRNEKLLIEKKTREDFILQKPIILGKINEYEKKIKGFEDLNKKNESEIAKLSNASKLILKQLKESQKSKPMDYDKLISIENNPFENMDQKIILLESLIKESKDRQNEFIDIFEYYDDYVQQKEKYDIINDEAKMIEEKNFLNINNNDNNENNLINDENNIINNENENNIENIEEDKSQEKEENILNNSPSSINSKNKEKFNENEKEEDKEDTKENKEEIIQQEIKEQEKEKEVINTVEEKKYKNFQFLLAIIFMNQGLKKEKIEKIISEENSDTNEDNNNYLSNLSQKILNLIEDKNEKDIKTLTKIFKYQLEQNYSTDINTFKEKIIQDFLENNKFTLIQSEEDENLYLTKLIQLYGPSCNNLIEKLKLLQKDEKKLISYKSLKKMIKEENLYDKKDQEKINIFNFFIFVLKKNSSFNDESTSISDFYIYDILNFLKGITDILSGKKLESDEVNEEDDGLTITDEDFKKIMNKFLKELNEKMEEKKVDLEELLEEENIKEIEKDGKSLKVIDIYKFVEKLRENEINLGDSLVISCIFNRYQLNENSEDINLDALQNDLEKKQIIL